ncbi:Protein PHOX1 [Vitis vinifera]|uniref:Protein PHOX1 n=2 Tax=Vitis vinifera TaxID=29760 RepID=A0A438J899_VITVI|nr:Protein PHOX1 [Vitis vinifera]
MGKQSLKKKNQGGGKPGDGKVKQSKVGDNGARPYDKDTAVFIEMSQELKEEGNKLFQKRDHEGAMLKYEKALKLLPRNHVDVAYLRSNMAACYMQMGLSDYPRAIHECNLALEVAPKYSKALLKRARCYEALNRLDLALRDVTTILNMEPNNLMALEIGESVKKAIEKKGIKVNDRATNLAPEYFVPSASTSPKVVKAKTQKKKSEKIEEKKAENKVVVEEKKAEEKVVMEEKKAEDKVVVEEKINRVEEEEPKKTVKLVFGEDIRRAQDQEGDLVTITTNEELKLAEASVGTQGSIRLYVVEVNPEQDPFFERVMNEVDANKIDMKQNNGTLNGTVGKCKETGIGSSYIDDWIIQFAQLFKNHVGFDSDEYLDLHEHGIKFYSEAMEETVTSEEAQGLFEIAAEKFQEMAALALFNWGNVHMSRARKRVYFTEDASRESVLVQIKTAHDWAQKEYLKAKQRYEEALKIKPDFYEGLLALGQQQFEQAKLSWYYAIGSNVDLEMWPCEEVLQLYNKAEDNMEKGMQMWEELEEQRLSELSKPNEVKIQLQNMGLDGLFKDISVSKAAEQAANMKSQINLIWGTMLYERSIVEFKLGLPVWQESLEVSVEKFELAGASPTDIAIMIKNHCSSNNALEDLGFKIDEIVQAWNEMYEAKRWQSGVPSFRLEPLFRRRVPKLYHALEHV